MPRLLSWSGKVDNPAESEYVLVEEAAGTQLGEIWEDIELESKAKVVEDIISIGRNLLLLSFTR